MMLQLLGLGAICLGYAIVGAIEGTEGTVKVESKSNNSKYDDMKNETYDYWKNLSSVEQEEYFNKNYKLKEYGENYRYDNKEQMAKSVSDIAYKEGRSFTDKYDRY